MAAAIAGGVLDKPLLKKALEDPVNITIAVFVAGLLFRWLERPLEKVISAINRGIPFPLLAALTVILLGLLSSVITAIIAALILVVIVSVLRLDRKSETQLVVYSCFSIGLGAALTPIGEPLSTLAISKLGEDFFYLLRLIEAGSHFRCCDFRHSGCRCDQTRTVGDRAENGAYTRVLCGDCGTDSENLLVCDGADLARRWV